MCDKCEETIYNPDGTRKAVEPTVVTPIGLTQRLKNDAKIATPEVAAFSHHVMVSVLETFDNVGDDLYPLERAAVDLLLEAVKKAKETA